MPRNATRQSRIAQDDDDDDASGKPMQIRGGVGEWPPALLLRVAAHYGVAAAPADPAQPAEHTPQATAETAEADAS